MTTALRAADVPTLHFVGVTTTQSSIMSVFPRWAAAFGLGPCAINGIDLPLHAPDASYRCMHRTRATATVAFLRDDPLTRGALVTAHKIDVFHACDDLFDTLDPYAVARQEVSCPRRR